MLDTFNKILILSPHPDDAEFGLGGTINRLINAGKEVHVVVFSTCIESTPEGFEPGVIEEEMFESLAFMGIKREHIYLQNFPVRNFPQYRQDILELMVQLRKTIQPDTIFAPSSSDIHQDHSQIHIEALRAFKHCNLLGYEMPWNNFEFNSMFYVPLSKEDVEKKIATLEIYKSQAFRPYSNINFIDSLSKIRGTQIGKNFAESFELIRYISN